MKYGGPVKSRTIGVNFRKKWLNKISIFLNENLKDLNVIYFDDVLTFATSTCLSALIVISLHIQAIFCVHGVGIQKHLKIAAAYYSLYQKSSRFTIQSVQMKYLFRSFQFEVDFFHGPHFGGCPPSYVFPTYPQTIANEN